MYEFQHQEVLGIKGPFNRKKYITYASRFFPTDMP